MKVYYTLEHIICRGVWIIFKNVEREHSFNFVGIFKGTKQECLKYAEEWNIKLMKN